MRIALVTDWFYPRIGGIEQHVLSLARLLHRSGHDVHVITPWPGPEDVDGVPVVRIPIRLVPRLGVSLNPWRLARRLGPVLQGGEYDVIHNHMSFGSTASMVAMYLGSRAGVPVLTTLHSVYRRLGWVYVMAQPILRWRQWTFQATAVSEAVAEDLRWMAPGRPIDILQNAIDPDEWVLEGEVSKPGRLRLVTAARLQRRKRVDALIKIFAKLREEVQPTIEVTLEIIGDGPDRRKLTRLCKRLALGNSVRFLGAGSAEDVRAMLSRGDVFANACVLESFGIAALEALSCGIPVVARSEGGVGSFIEDGENGVLVASDSEMLSVLVRMADDAERLAELRIGASAGIPAAYSWGTLVEQHLGLYRGLTEPSPAVHSG
jgi:glycosyltransferase involved in cell wall biosynthesis